MRRFCVKYGMLFVITLSLAAAGWGLAQAMMVEPGPVRVDCRGKNIDVEAVRHWEEQEKDGYLGLVDAAGWRVENQGKVTAVSTGRNSQTRVTGIYGPMELVYPAKIISGTYGSAMGSSSCVLSESLAYELFGDTDIAGEQCRLDGKVLEVAGVIDKKEKYLLLPITEGPLEQLALEFKSRWKVDEKVRELLGGV